MSTFRFIANINGGDNKTTDDNLYFKIYNNGVLYHTTNKVISDANVELVGSTVTISNVSLTDGISYNFTITSIDEAGNESLPSNVIGITAPDVTNPIMGNNALTYNNITNNSVQLSCTNVSDNVGVTSFDVYLDAVLYVNIIASTLNNRTISGLSSAANYDIFVEAKDAAGNRSLPSNIINFTTLSDVITPTTTPILSNFRIDNAQPSRVYFDASSDITGLTTTGFVISGKTISSLTIDQDGLGGYFTVSVPFTYWDNNTIRLGEIGATVQSSGIIYDFTMEYIVNNINEPSTTIVRYAAPTAQGTGDGTSAANAWSYSDMVDSTKLTSAGTLVHVKAGTSSAQLALGRSGTESAPIIYKGYKTTPGDLDGVTFYTYGDGALSGVDAPLLSGSGTGQGIYSTSIRNYIIIKNFQINNYDKGVRMWAGEVGRVFDNIVVANCVGYNFSSSNPANSKTRVKNSISLNSQAGGFEINGSHNLALNLKSYCDTGATHELAQDYYIVFNDGSNSIIKDCYIERLNNVAHSGHGYSFKGASYSLIDNCISKGTNAPFQFRHSTTNNSVSKNSQAYGNAQTDTGGIVMRDGAHHNTAENCLVKDVETAIGFTETTEDLNPNVYSAYENNIINCIFDNVGTAISNSYGTLATRITAKNNRIYNCTFKGITDRFFYFNANTETSEIKNCIVINAAANFSEGVYANGFTWTDCIGYNNAFANPTGMTTVNPLLDANYVPAAAVIQAATKIAVVNYDYNGKERENTTTIGAVCLTSEAVVEPIFTPKLSNFRIDNAQPSRVYFDASGDITGLTTSGFVIAGKTISSLTIDVDKLGGYFTVTVPFTFWDNNTIRLGEIEDADHQSVIHNFSLEHIVNNINEPVASTYRYVTNTATGTNNGTSEALSWTIEQAAANATAGMTVWIKAGNYAKNGNSTYPTYNCVGTATSPIKFIGYKTTPGDITSNYITNYNGIKNNWNTSEMPTFTHTGVEFTSYGGLFNAGTYLIFKYIQYDKFSVAQRYSNGGTNGNYMVFEGINAKEGITNDLAYSSSGAGLLFRPLLNNTFNYLRFKNIVLLNYGMVGLGLDSSSNSSNTVLQYWLMDNIKVFCDNILSPARQDYYLSLSGHYGTVKNCYIEQFNSTSTGGSTHGIGVRGGSATPSYNKLSTYILMVDSESYNVQEGFYVRNNNSSRNVIKRNKVGLGSMPNLTQGDTGGFQIVSGCNYNLFENNYIDGVSTGIFFLIGSEDDEWYAFGKNNIIRNNIFKGGHSVYHINSNSFLYLNASTAITNYVDNENNQFYNNTISDFNYFLDTPTDNGSDSYVGLIFKNNSISDIPGWYGHFGSSSPVQVYENNNFYNVGSAGDAYVGIGGNTGINPNFVNSVDFVPQGSLQTVAKIEGVDYDYNGKEREDITTIGAVCMVTEEAGSTEIVPPNLGNYASTLGMIPNSTAAKLTNANLLISGLNTYGHVVIDGNYYVSTPSTSLTATTVKLTGINGGSLKTNDALTTLFNPIGLTSIDVIQTTFTDEYAGGGAFRLFYTSTRATDSSTLIKFDNNTFNGNVHAIRKEGSSTTNPTTFKINEFIFTNNTVNNSKLGCVTLWDMPYDVATINNNIVNNFSDYIVFLGIYNDQTYTSQRYTTRPLTYIRNNIVTCDNNWSGTATINGYYTFVLVEADVVYYEDNHVEGMHSLLDISLYDAYLSSNTVHYNRNVNKNNVLFRADKYSNVLIKSKEAQVGVIATRNYENNQFITEASWMSAIAHPLNLGYMFIHEFPEQESNILMRGNTFDLYEARSLTSPIKAKTFIYDNNSFTADFVGQGLLTDYIVLSDSFQSDTISITNNVFDITGATDPDGFGFVGFIDQRTDKSIRAGNVTVSNNSGNMHFMYAFWRLWVNSLTMQNNTIINKNTGTTYDTGNIAFSNEGQWVTSNITATSINNSTARLTLEGLHRYGYGAKNETITYQANLIGNASQGMWLDDIGTNTTPTNYRRTYEFQDGQKFYFDFSIYYQTDHMKVAFTNSSNVSVSYRINKNNDNITEGNNVAVKLVDFGTPSNTYVVTFKNDNDYQMFALPISLTNKQVKITTVAAVNSDVDTHYDMNTSSVYAQSVSIPAYNAGNSAHKLITPTNGGWADINNGAYTHFYVQPGDYTSKTNTNSYAQVTLTANGTSNARRYISLYNGNNTHPSQLAVNTTNLAKVGFIITGDYWVIDRMAYWDRPQDALQVNEINGGENNIINRYFQQNVGGACVTVYVGSHSNLIQNCRVERTAMYLNGYNQFDRGAFQLMDVDGTATQQARDNKFVQNETYNYNDGFHALRQFSDANTLSYEGTIVDCNSFWIDSTIYCNSDGTQNANGAYADAENAIDIKCGSANPANPMIISNNYGSGFRPANPNNTDLSDTGCGIVLHFGVFNTIIENNFITDTSDGFGSSTGYFGLPSADNLIVRNNIFTNIKKYSIEVYDISNTLFEDNLFLNIGASAPSYSMKFRNFTGNLFENVEWRNNRVFTDTSINGAESEFSLVTPKINNEYYQATALSNDLNSASNTVYTTNPTLNYTNLKVSLNRFSNNPNILTFEKVIDVNRGFKLGYIPDYYVSSTDGNDSNNGLTPETAWATIDKFDDVVFPENTVIALKKGDVFTSQIRRDNKTTALTITTYGSGNKPVIDLFENFTYTFTNIGGNIWRGPTLGYDFPYRLKIDGVEQLGGYYYESDSRNFISYSQLGTYIPDLVKWWYGDNGSGTRYLYVYSVTNPSTSTFTFCNVDNNVRLNEVDNVTFDGLEFKGSQQGNILLLDCNNITFRNCDITETPYVQGGIRASRYAAGNTNLIVENCNFDTRFELDYSSAGDYSGATAISTADGIALQEMTGGIIRNNTFRNWGHAAISVTAAVGQEISNLEVYGNYSTLDTNMTYGGGFTTDRLAHHNEFYNNTLERTKSSQFNGYSNHIHHNIFKNAIKSPHHPSWPEGWGISAEVYAGTCHDNIFENNVFDNCETGGIRIYGEAGSYGHIVRNNIMYNCGSTNNNVGMEIGYTGSTIYNNSVRNNLVYNSTTSNTIKYYGTTMTVATLNTQTSNGNTISNNISGNPLFVGVSDYHLQAGSPAINAGITPSASLDYVGNTIPYLATTPDIGIYEYGY